MEITHLGSGIWRYNWRMTGAILLETRPAIIIRSDCRGEPRNTSAPKRAASYRDAIIDIISMAQHANPKVMGQREFFLAQLRALSSVVVIMLSRNSSPESSIREKSSGGWLISNFSESPTLLVSHATGGR